jgi:hypothetical protein
VLCQASNHANGGALEPSLNCADVSPINTTRRVQIHLGNSPFFAGFPECLSERSFQSRLRLDLFTQFSHLRVIVVELMVINQRVITIIFEIHLSGNALVKPIGFSK